MGCSSSAGRGTNAQHDVCVTCASPVLAPEDFAPFFGDWIMKACAEMKLSCISSRPQLGPELPKAGSRLERQLRAAILNSKVAVCILNMTKGCEMPPPGIKAEVTWASQRNIPVVPFYDADRYDWKEAATWKVEIPICFRWGLGPVRYKRQAHEEAKEQLRAALRAAMKDLEFRGSTQEQEQKEQQRLQQVAQSLGGGAERGGEFSRAELRLREARHSSSASQEAAARRAALVAEEADLEDVALGLDRSDFERAGLVPQRLERTNSMRDINLDSALAILARGAAQTRDPLAAREGGCQLQLISEDVNQELLQGGDPKHRILAPVKGILRKAKGVAAGGAGGLPSGTVKQLRLSPEALEQRRFRFSVQLLQNHLDQLQTDDVHELITVLKCLQGGEQPLVLRSLRLLKAFLEAHVVLHDRALQQGLIESVVDVMRQQAEVDVLTLGVACLSAVLRGAAQRGMLGPEALNFCGRSEVPPLAQEDLVTSISKSGGVPAILDGMRRFPACEGLVEKGCLCVVLLTSGTEDNKVSADYAQGQHQESSVLLRSQSRRLVARLGGVELLMKAMQRFTRNEPLQRSCCAALGQLANEVKEVDVEQKVVQLLMQALRAPPRAAGGTEASSCARYGAQALRHFATHGETKSFIARLGGIEELHDLALRGLQAPSTNQQLRAAATEALGALCHLASKHPENKLRIFEAGCLELAFQALGSSTTAPAETAEGVEASEATEVPEPELAMAACGLLHNMSVDAAIRSHVVKLGGRAAAERLAASHPEGAVRNLAMLLSKTLKPREEAAGDPFGALFAQRTPGLAAPRRVASKRERKIASEVKAAYAQAEEPR